MLHTIYAWAVAHPTELPLLLATIAALLRALYALVSRIVAPYPRLRALVEAAAAVMPDVIRAGQQLASALLGRAVPSLDLRAPDDDREALRAEIDSLRRALAALRDGAVVVQSPGTAAQVDEALARQRGGGQSGHAPVGALVVAMLLSLVMGAAVYACTPAREAVMRVTPGVPAAVNCTPDTQRCNGTMPEHCSSSGRWWPSLSRRADGSQRQCARGCSMDASGVASCIGPIEAEAGL